jgi:hypothetical protein
MPDGVHDTNRRDGPSCQGPACEVSDARWCHPQQPLVSSADCAARHGNVDGELEQRREQLAVLDCAQPLLLPAGELVRDTLEDQRDLLTEQLHTRGVRGIEALRT